MTNTTRNLSQTDQHDLPLDMSGAAHAANAALFAGKEALETAREGWAMVKETFGEARGSLSEGGSPEYVARRLAVRLEQAAGRTLGLVSSSACGLWGVGDQGRIFQVDATDGGSDYLRGVRYVGMIVRGNPAMENTVDEIPVRMVAAFFDSFEEAHEFVNPAPRRGFFG